MVGITLRQLRGEEQSFECDIVNTGEHVSIKLDPLGS